MDILQIKRADALKAYDNAGSKGKTLLSDLFGKSLLSGKDRIKTVDDALDVMGIDRNAFYIALSSLTADEQAYRQLKVIAEALNEGWKANWKDGNQRKWYNWFTTANGGFRFVDVRGDFQGSCVSSRLCFKSRELAEYAGKQFTDLYEAYLNG